MNSNMMSGIAGGTPPANMMQQQQASGILDLVKQKKIDPAMAKALSKGQFVEEQQAIEAELMRQSEQTNQVAGMQIDPRTTVEKIEQVIPQLLGSNTAMGGQGPGIQQRGQMMAQQQQRPPQQPQQPQQGIASQPAPNMARMAGGGIVSFREGGMPPAKSRAEVIAEEVLAVRRQMEAAGKTQGEKSQLLERLTEYNDEMDRDSTGNLRVKVNQTIDRMQGNAPEGGMYGGGRVKGYAKGDRVTKTNDPEMYAIDDVLGYINAESRNAGQRIVEYDEQGNPITVEDLKKIMGMSEKESNYETPGSERAQMSSTSPNMEDRILAMLQGMNNPDATRNLNEAVANIPIGGFTASLINSFLENPEGNTQEQVEPTRQGGIGELEQNALIAESSAPQGLSSADQARQAEMDMYAQLNAKSQARGLENMVARVDKIPQGLSSADQARQAEMDMYAQLNAQSQARGLENMVARANAPAQQETSSRQGMQNAEDAMYAQLAGRDSEEDVDTGTPVEMVQEGDFAGDLIAKTTSFIQKEWEEDPMGVIATAMMMLPVAGWTAGVATKIAGPILKKYGTALGRRILQVLKKTYSKPGLNTSKFGPVNPAVNRVISPGRASFSGGAALTLADKALENSDGTMDLLGGNGETSTPTTATETTAPATATATAPEQDQDIVDAYQEAVMADRADTSRGFIVDPLTNFLGEEGAARQRTVNGGEGKREIDMRRLTNAFAGMAGKTSGANALAGAATADQIYGEQQTADELKREELEVSREQVRSQERAASQRTGILKMELDLKNRLAGDAQLLQYAPQIASLAAQILDAKVKELDPGWWARLWEQDATTEARKTQRRELEIEAMVEAANTYRAIVGGVSSVQVPSGGEGGRLPDNVTAADAVVAD